MTDTNLTVVSYRTRDTECLQTYTDSFGSISSVFATFLDSDSSTYYVSPLSIFKTDRLSFFTRFIRINSSSFADSVSFFDVFDAVRDVYKRQPLSIPGVIRTNRFLWIPTHALRQPQE